MFGAMTTVLKAIVTVFLAMNWQMQALTIIVITIILWYLKIEHELQTMNRKHAELIAAGASPLDAALKSGCFTAGCLPLFVISILCILAMYILGTYGTGEGAIWTQY